ncbi:CPBP family intramembrane metalloprotease [Leptobacterium flavescens]|uniref:CPBP family intramembrane metalloprotease n=1 Tax=Leptobacterium flavescens TaxID=472055 RepID=A0A6P0UTX6_9FLAO|nr:CPBP family intramembrane glutamic endopeptidase [Leptobacterium flavescens]NER13876.1 CPBP family intramembrane metalloprotease [Leptobacterium flavescens]
MYLAQAFKVKHDFWRYVIGSIAVIGVNFVAQIPFIIAIVFKDGFSGLSVSDESDLLNILDSNTTLFLILLPFAASLIALYFVVKYLHKQSWRSVTTSRKKIDWKRVFFAFGLWAVVTVILTFIDYYSSPEDYVWNFKFVPFLILFIIAVIFIPLQTSLEEYLFRGYLMQGFGTLFRNKWIPLIMTSLIFGGLHYFNPEVAKLGNTIMIYYIGTGFFLGIMTLMDEGMELALGYHAANNLITALLVTADWTVFRTHSLLRDVSEPVLGFDVFIPVFVIFPTILFIFSRKYKWTNWKDKLFGKVEEPVEEIILGEE